MDYLVFLVVKYFVEMLYDKKLIADDEGETLEDLIWEKTSSRMI